MLVWLASSALCWAVGASTSATSPTRERRCACAAESEPAEALRPRDRDVDVDGVLVCLSGLGVRDFDGMRRERRVMPAPAGADSLIVLRFSGRGGLWGRADLEREREREVEEEREGLRGRGGGAEGTGFRASASGAAGVIPFVVPSSLALSCSRGLIRS